MKNYIFVIGIIFTLSTADAFSLRSKSLKDKEMVPQKHVYNSFGCEGENISPALEWKDPPKGTKSFAITVFDPDAPTGSGWWHWTVANLPAHISQLEEGASGKEMPDKAVEGRTDFGESGYGGPCPPKGETHRYIFNVYALKTEKLDLTKESPGAQFGYYIHQNSLGKASFTIKYRR
jgi:Raf kinase inhibitor-like YbhB/YbcL family protein